MEDIELKDVYKIYGTEKGIIALKNINFFLEKGEFIAVMGPSGSGKSTLLKVISSIITPSAGEVIIKGYNVNNLDDDGRREFRRKNFSFVFQDVKLIKDLTIKDNILYPLLLEKKKEQEDIEYRVNHSLSLLEIETLALKRVGQLSGGQSQKGEIARAIAQDKGIMFLDEPTSKLDFNSTKKVMKILRSINKKEGKTIFLVTHDPFVASYANRVLFIKDGEIYSEIHSGEERKAFYRDILEFNTFLGGKKYGS
ncbi:ABC transporter ATP-binding protein [Clostridium sp. MB40-C1]|uniref:ABC transporter ATP-binding protein n=1 Tax=Clostridium sp. MB40-C1 TaxID=3070996 RepID=UPI0027DED80F|nr:ABC transporter ATP-binding protein [Clostridium sp. MB40-C1]WMJ79726.1 ABC transporter ATP-binding protein [Clostridium sp. MB40-C1]